MYKSHATFKQTISSFFVTFSRNAHPHRSLLYSPSSCENKLYFAGNKASDLGRKTIRKLENKIRKMNRNDRSRRWQKNSHILLPKYDHLLHEITTYSYLLHEGIYRIATGDEKNGIGMGLDDKTVPKLKKTRDKVQQK